MSHLDPLFAGMLTGVLGVMIPIIAIVMGIGTGMLQIYLSYRKRMQMFTLYHQERLAAIDKGIELPPLPEEFFTDDTRSARPRSPHRHLLIGLVFLLGGLGALVALYLNDRVGAAYYSLIPVGIGVASLIYYLAVGRREAEMRLAASKTSPPDHSRTPVA